MFKDTFEEDDQECILIYDRVIDYLRDVQYDDDLTVKNIEGRVLGYFLCIGLEELSDTCNDFKNSLLDLSTTIANGMMVVK